MHIRCGHERREERTGIIYTKHGMAAQMSADIWHRRLGRLKTFSAWMELTSQEGESGVDLAALWPATPAQSAKDNKNIIQRIVHTGPACPWSWRTPTSGVHRTSSKGRLRVYQQVHRQLHQGERGISSQL